MTQRLHLEGQEQTPMNPCMTHVWLIGQLGATEAVSLPEWAIDAFPCASFRQFRTVRMGCLHHADPADVVVIVQHRPREFSRSDVAELMSSQPLAQFLVGIGAWCESSARTEAIWPESIVVPIRALPGALARLAGHEKAGITLPPWQTCGRDERWLCESLPEPCAVGCSIVVESSDKAFGETVAAFAADLFVSPAPQTTTGIGRIVLWDADPVEVRVAQLADYRRHRPADRIVALLGLPTEGDAAQLREVGAEATLSKPLIPTALHDAVASLTTRAA